MKVVPRSATFLLLMFAAASPLVAQRVLLQNHPCAPARSTEGATPTSIEFVNRTDESVDVFWMNYNAVREFYVTLPPGGTYVQPTYVTHPWISIGQTTGRCYGLWMPSPEPGRALIGDCTPPQVSPQVAPPATTTVAARDEVTVEWSTPESVDRFMGEVSARPDFERSLQVLLGGSERSATFSFPLPGTYYLRLWAMNACGRKEGVPTLQFTVTPPPPRVVVTAKPSGMLQVVGEPSIDSYTLTNFGGQPTAISLAANGDFFTQSPTQFTLAPGASRIVTINATAQYEGSYSGASIPAGNGVPEGLRIPVHVLAATRPSGNPDAWPDVRRLEVQAPPGESPTGVLELTNRGTGPVKGVMVADVPWIEVLDDFVNIPPGGKTTVRFRVNRLLRARTNGSASGRLVLVYLQGSLGKFQAAARRIFGAAPPPNSKSTPISVSDTVQPTLSSSAIPPLAANEVAFFIPGVGRTSTGASAKTDLALLNTNSVGRAGTVKMFFTAAGSTTAQGTTFSAMSADSSLQLADVTKSVFNNTTDIGALQVRAGSLDEVVVDADQFVDTGEGLLGTRLPVFRSDRAAAAGEKLFLAGLLKDPLNRTDLLLQETAGQTATVSIEFLQAPGSVVGTRTVTLQPFGFTLLNDALPIGAVAAVVSNTSTAGGRIQAYGAVTDSRSNDTWAVPEWATTLDYGLTEPVVVPVTGKMRGLHGADFRSGIAIFNTGSATASGTLTFYPTSGDPVSSVVTLGPRESRVLSDVLTSQFAISRNILGYLVFTPTNGSFAVSARTYSTSPQTGATFNSSVPVLPLSSALKRGQVKKFAGIKDASYSNTTGAKPGTYRTNFGLLETRGDAATVRATLRYTAVQGSASAVGVASAEFPLRPHDFLMFNSITTAILRAERGNFGDLHDIQVDFEIIDGDGEVLVFLSSTENATSDTAVRAE